VTNYWSTPTDPATNVALRTLATRVDKLEQAPPWHVIGKVELGPDDVLFIRPTAQAMTPNQARELTAHLEEKLHRQVVVLPFPAEVALTHVSKDMTLAALTRINQLECDIKALKAALPHGGLRVIT
jgi:hypothetical protein